ncbi:MAG: ABC transporter ATP-binding protein [Candidatus Coproplasma sp.]
MKRRGTFSRLLRYGKRYSVLLVLVMMLCIISVCLTVFGTTHMRDLTNYINDAATSGAASIGEVLELSVIARLCGTLIAMYVGAALCNFLQSFLMTSVTQGVSKNLRSDLADKTNRLPISYFDSHKTGDTLSRVTNDIDTVAQSLQTAVSTTVSSVVQIVLVVTVMFVTNWQMSLTALATVPLSLLLMLLVVKVSQRYFKRQQTELGVLNGNAEECYSGMEVIRAFNAQSRVTEKFGAQNEKLKRAMRKANILSGITHPLTTFVSKLGYVAICVVGGILMAQGRTDLGALAAFLLYINLFQSPISSLGQTVSSFQQASAASDRVFEYLDAKEQESEQEKRAYLAPESVKGDVEFRNVKFGYSPEKTIIHGFNAEIKAGQKVAIVGPTGAGKTTLVNLLMRFYESDSGEILVDGVPLSSLKRENVRELFSMVLQDTWLFDGTVKENIIFSEENVTEERLKEAEKQAQIRKYIQTLPDGEDSPVSDDGLSGGQKQLLTIARAMLKDSPMMILDEATSNVDTATEAAIQRAMDNLTKNKTSFVIAHRLSTIKNADLILVLKDGDVIEQGNHDTLIKQNGFYAELYNSQFAS